jgi:homoserine O-succinyltransferase
MATISILTGLTQNAIVPSADALHLLVLNLMPNRAVTERQLANVFAQGKQDVALTFCLPSTHHINKNATQIRQAYATFDQVEAQYFDGLIVTGAPLDQLEFEQVDFWPEFRRILTWRKAHTKGALFICWGAYAAGELDGVFHGKQLAQKISGIYTTDGLTMPHSRYFTIPLASVVRGNVLAGSQALGATLISDSASNSWYLAGHLEYQTGTLRAEYYRDLHKDPHTPLPAHYFDSDLQPQNTWHDQATQVYTSWLNTLTTARRQAHG